MMLVPFSFFTSHVCTCNENDNFPSPETCCPFLVSALRASPPRSCSPALRRVLLDMTISCPSLLYERAVSIFSRRCDVLLTPFFAFRRLNARQLPRRLLADLHATSECATHRRQGRQGQWFKEKQN
jgi:hypothetical protein